MTGPSEAHPSAGVGHWLQVIILNDPSHGFNYTRRKRLREDLKVILDDKRWQWVIIALVILDALLVRGHGSPRAAALAAARVR